MLHITAWKSKWKKITGLNDAQVNAIAKLSKQIPSPENSIRVCCHSLMFLTYIRSFPKQQLFSSHKTLPQLENDQMVPIILQCPQSLKAFAATCLASRVKIHLKVMQNVDGEKGLRVISTSACEAGTVFQLGFFSLCGLFPMKKKWCILIITARNQRVYSRGQLLLMLSQTWD